MINEKKFTDTYVHFDKETVVEIIDIFLEEYNERIEKVSKQLKNKDIEELKRSAHAFKGVIANFETECKAYEEISEILDESYQAIESENFDELSEEEKMELMKKLQDKFDAFKKHSRQMYNQLKDIRKNYAD